MNNCINVIIILLPNHLIAICQPAHTGHNSQHIIVGGIHSDFGSLGAFHGCVRQDKLKGCVVNTRKVASAGRLVFFRAKGKRIHVDTFIRATSVGLVRLHPREIRTFALRETILAVELEFGSNHRVLSPTVHVKRSFG